MRATAGWPRAEATRSCCRLVPNRADTGLATTVFSSSCPRGSTSCARWCANRAGLLAARPPVQVKPLNGPSLTAGDLICRRRIVGPAGAHDGYSMKPSSACSSSTAGRPISSPQPWSRRSCCAWQGYGAHVGARDLHASRPRPPVQPAPTSRYRSRVSPGEYIVRATVRGGSETVAELYRDVVVVAGSRPAATQAPALPRRASPGCSTECRVAARSGAGSLPAYRPGAPKRRTVRRGAQAGLERSPDGISRRIRHGRGVSISRPPTLRPHSSRVGTRRQRR